MPIEMRTIRGDAARQMIRHAVLQTMEAYLKAHVPPSGYAAVSSGIAISQESYAEDWTDESTASNKVMIPIPLLQRQLSADGGKSFRQ